MNRLLIACRKVGFGVYAAAVAVLAASVAQSQEYGMLGGNPERTGHHNANQQQYNPGRGYLRWWDPVSNVSKIIDNADPEASFIPNSPVHWRIPTGIRAYNAYEPNFAVDPYRYAAVVPSLSYDKPTQKQNPADTLRTFTFTFQNTLAYPINAGDEVALSVNIPVGPTFDNLVIRLFYPQRYYVYEITGVVGGPIVDIVDTFVSGGGWIRLGGGGYPTDRLFVVDNTATVRVTLYNTVPRDAQGNLTDTVSGVVYGDAAKITKALFGQLGSYEAAPVVGQVQAGGEPYPWRVVGSRNEPMTVQVGGEVLTYNLGQTTSYVHEGTTVNGTRDFGRNVVWAWPAIRPYIDSQTDAYSEARRSFVIDPTVTPTPSASDRPDLNRSKVTIDKDNAGTGVTTSFGWLVGNGVVGFRGIDYLTTPASNTITATVSYAPKLNDGSYEVYAWLPLDNGFRAGLGRRVQYELYEGGTPTILEVDQTLTGGWVRLRTQLKAKFNHNNASAPLRVVVTNLSPGDQGLAQIYADSIRFVTTADLRVASTPVHTRARIQVSPGVFADRDVVIVAMENGRIYCLDAQGQNDTTTVYWVYPSEKQLGPLPGDNQDPNRVVGADGPGGIAEMPIGFDTSSALVQRIDVGGNPEDFLYIGSKNGRVYCIRMDGNADGTTSRRWSYPDDYPVAAVNSALGPITGSLAHGDIGNIGNPDHVIYVPTEQGRVYCLDALGNAVQRTTAVRWAYPLVTDPTIGPVRTTPVFFGGGVYFGTDIATGDTAGRFYCVNAASGALIWQFAGNGPNPTLAFGKAGAAVVPANYVNYGAKNAMTDTVFVGNSNGRMYALNAATGATIWETPELGASPAAAPTFTWLRTYDTGGNVVAPPGQPTIVFPLVDGRFTALYGNVADLNVLGIVDGSSRSAWEYRAEAGTVSAGMAVGGELTPIDPNDPNSIAPSNWLYSVDNIGFLYAFSDVNLAISPGPPPGSRTLVPNDPTTGIIDQIAQNARVALITPENYELISDRVRTGNLAYTDITNAGVTQAIQRRKYEFGEVLYLLVFDLPDPQNLPPPANTYQIDFNFNSPGQASQRRIVSPTPINNGAPPGRERFALTAYVVMGTQAEAVAPGVSFAITRVRLANDQNTNRQINQQNLRFLHPLAVEVRRPGGAVDTIGKTIDINTDAEILNNGNDVVGLGYKEMLSGLGPDLANPGDWVSHGQIALGQVLVYDRSLMTLMRGSNSGLSNVRAATNDIAWQGGAVAVIKPLDPTMYPMYEELPAFLPNVSIDYPDIRRDGIKMATDVYGDAGNPLYQGVNLKPPSGYEGALAAYRGFPGYESGLARTLVPTLFDVSLDVPRFQPPSTQGYKGVQVFYADNSQPGRQFSGGAATEAYREVSLYSGVVSDERMSIGTPVVDLGSLPAGGGFGPIEPWNNGSPFNPWNTAFNSFFQRFSAYNEGNVNMLNVRMPKGNAVVGLVPIPLIGPALHELGWLDAVWSLWSDLDPRFAPPALNGVVIFQKPRPGDPVASRLSVNPIRRRNANLGVLVEGPHPLLDPNVFPPGDPKVGVTAPIGAPVGSYRQDIGVIEDRNNNLILDTDDPYADPAFTLIFKVRETRLTNRNTTKAAPMIDDLGLNGNESFAWTNTQPSGMRDAAGNLLVAFASPRVVDVGNDGNKSNDVPGWLSRLRDELDFSDPDARNEQWRIYIATLDGNQPSNGLGASPLADLNVFAPSTNSRWFIHAGGPLPSSTPDTLFGPLNPGESIVPGSAKYGSPVFAYGAPFNVLSSPANRTANSQYYLAFVGECQKRNQRGEISTESRIFTVSIIPGATGLRGIVEPAGILPYDPQARKGKPSLLQVGNFASMFYTMNAGGSTQIFWSNYTPQGPADQRWSPPRSLDLGAGFESVGTPSATLRRYRNGNGARIDLVFTGKVRGRSQQETFLTRVAADQRGYPAGRNPALFFAQRTDPLTIDPVTGLYWTEGLQWSLNTSSTNPIPDVDVYQLTNTGLVSILDQNSGRFDSATGIVSFDSKLGGRAYLNAATGSVRFSGAAIGRDARLYIKYMPKFVRVSGGLGANYRGATLAYDDRYVGEFSFWADSSNNGVPPGANCRADRFLVSHTKVTTDGASAPKPYLRTYRFGVRLPSAVQTNANGSIAFLQVTGMNGPFYQIDPANGRLYFMAEDEDNPNIQISYRGVDENGVPYPNVIGPINATVGLITETDETSIPIEQAVNESAMSMALDPFPLAPNQPRRPGLVWLFWASTRSGVPDLYFQTIAPRFTPKPPGR